MAGTAEQLLLCNIEDLVAWYTHPGARVTLHSDKPELTGPVIGKLSLRPSQAL